MLKKPSQKEDPGEDYSFLGKLLFETALGVVESGKMSRIEIELPFGIVQIDITVRTESPDKAMLN